MKTRTIDCSKCTYYEVVEDPCGCGIYNCFARCKINHECLDGDCDEYDDGAAAGPFEQ